MLNIPSALMLGISEYNLQTFTPRLYVCDIPYLISYLRPDTIFPLATCTHARLHMPCNSRLTCSYKNASFFSSAIEYSTSKAHLVIQERPSMHAFAILVSVGVERLNIFCLLGPKGKTGGGAYLHRTSQFGRPAPTNGLNSITRVEKSSVSQ